MTLTLNITDDLNSAEASELVEIAKEEGRPVGQVILDAARDRARKRRESRAQSQTESVPTPHAA